MGQIYNVWAFSRKAKFKNNAFITHHTSTHKNTTTTTVSVKINMITKDLCLIRPTCLPKSYQTLQRQPALLDFKD